MLKFIMKSSKSRMDMTKQKQENPLANISSMSQFLEKSPFNNISEIPKKIVVSNSIIN